MNHIVLVVAFLFGGVSWVAAIMLAVCWYKGRQERQRLERSVRELRLHLEMQSGGFRNRRSHE